MIKSLLIVVGSFFMGAKVQKFVLSCIMLHHLLVSTSGACHGKFKLRRNLPLFAGCVEGFLGALGNLSYDNRFLAVDMEWAFAQSDIDIKDRIPRTRIDLVLVDTIPNEQGLNDIYLAELKVGTVATEGTSGTIDHVEKTFKLINTEKACQDFKEDVTNIINVKSELGIYTGTAKQFNLADKPKMMLILAYRGEEEHKRLLKDSTAAQEKAKELGMDEIKIVMHNALIKLD